MTHTDPIPHVVITGVGGYGRLHLENGRRLAEAGRLAIVGLVDPAVAARRDRDGDIPLYADLEAALANHRTDIVIVATPLDTHERLAEIAKLQGKDWRDAAMDLVLTEHRRVETIYFLMSEDNLAMQLKLPWIKIGTDSVGMNPEGAKDLAHPRSYGTFPKILGEFVREKKIMPLEEAVRKMTSATARRVASLGCSSVVGERTEN